MIKNISMSYSAIRNRNTASLCYKGICFNAKGRNAKFLTDAISIGVLVLVSTLLLQAATNKS